MNFLLSTILFLIKGKLCQPPWPQSPYVKASLSKFDTKFVSHTNLSVLSWRQWFQNSIEFINVFIYFFQITTVWEGSFHRFCDTQWGHCMGVVKVERWVLERDLEVREVESKITSSFLNQTSVSKELLRNCWQITISLMNSLLSPQEALQALIPSTLMRQFPLPSPSAWEVLEDQSSLFSQTVYLTLPPLAGFYEQTWLREGKKLRKGSSNGAMFFCCCCLFLFLRETAQLGKGRRDRERENRKQAQIPLVIHF